MKAQDLRIGNLVMADVEKGSAFDGLNFVVGWSEIRDSEILGDNWGYKPIPLTKEWLKRFNWNPPKDIGVSFSLTTDEIHFVAGNYYKKIKHVHQLQNLYFAITGEELNQNKEDE